MDEQRYGTDAGLGARQIHTPPAETLVKVLSTAESEETTEVRFLVPTPDSRLRVKVSVLFVKLPNQSGPVTDLGATLYLGAADQEVAGFQGDRIPTTDVLHDAAGAVVHQSTPLAIPEDPDLQGFSQEFVTAGDDIIGILTTGCDGPSGFWILQVRYQPDGQRLHDCDWSNAIRRCTPVRLGAMGAVGGG